MPSGSPAAEVTTLREDAITGVLEALRTFFPCPLGRFRDQGAPAVHRATRRKRLSPKSISDAG